MKTIRKVILFLFLAVPFVLQAQKVDRSVLLEDLEFLSSEKLRGRAPMSEGSRMAQDYIKERFKSLGLSSQFPDHSQKFRLSDKDKARDRKGVNIIGFVPGSESSRIILVMAHYDHLGTKEDLIFHGADDNASGAAALLSFAAYFAENRPEHSMLFAATDAEEMGLLGARALARDFPFPLDQISVVFNMDMIGRSDMRRLYAVGTRHYPQLKPFIEDVARRSKIELVPGNDGGGGKDWTNASDHAAFHEKGVPFIYFGVDDHKDYHKPSDTFENIDQEFYYQAVTTILDTIMRMDRGLK
ncbi:M28 family peptidase [Negadavirga shengliensis]|uniref:M28 family peptidase n=1 Tax=Negadavirga shengliensis TaxID=1389218 RepID=A0ABV9T5T5_9BACT